MRIIANIPHPRLTINIFSMNDKYQIKFEAGTMEQTYKIPHSEVEGVEALKKMVDDAFLNEVLNRFNDMFFALKAAKQRLTT
jgi:hypothetical protein